MTRLIYQGILIGVLITIFADGVHWFITPNSHDASSARRIAVLVQMLVVAAIAFLVWRRAKRDAMLLEIKLVSDDRGVNG